MTAKKPKAEDELEETLLEWLVIPISMAVKSSSANKLSLASGRVIQAETVAEALKRAGFPASTNSAKYLVIPLVEATVVAVRPKYEVDASPYESYKAL
jgi:hypothetical protein